MSTISSVLFHFYSLQGSVGGCEGSATYLLSGCSRDVDDLCRLMNITNSAKHVKTPVIPTTNPTFSPAMRDVCDGELEGETGKSLPLKEIMVILQYILARHILHVELYQECSLC